MRRTLVRKRLPRRPLRWLAALAVLLLLVLALCRYIEDRFEPILDELAEYEARAAVTRAVTDAVAAEMAASPGRYEHVYRVQYDEAGRAALQADTAAMNEARLALTAAAERALAALPPVRVCVPFGTLTGFSLFNSLGPGWPLCFQPEAFAEGTVRETVGTVGINAARCSAVLELKITVNMVLDGKNRVIYAETAVPIASVVVSGETPLCYSAGS